ncbi:M23 family metallopeptidase [Sedimentibacter sp. zth1]|uniref:M23 family metallopeptidase n=1 Tax=Sedimentibacter sp. zth1 TaxID=2816908 RepID=UPI001A9398A0|nr:M23 family metallopeptidase [Sedimentibacter sp. zth1]QSX05462.1 M23 family metallopeptidase [Sedimentibacter sp. zth1]
MDEDLKELDAMLRKIDAKVKRNAGYKLIKIIKKTLPTSAFIIFGIVLFLLIVIAVGAMLNSLKFFKIDDKVEDTCCEETSEFLSPKKISIYQEIENNSYTEYKDGEENVTEYLDGEETNQYTNEIDINVDMAKEHRLHWQLLAAIDLLSGLGGDPKDNTVEKLSKEITPSFKYTEYSETITSEQYIEVEVERQIPRTNKTVIDTVQKLQKTVIKRPQFVIKSVSSALFDVDYEYEKIKITDEFGNTRECYTIINVNKKVNNRLENFINNRKFKGRLTTKNILEIYDMGVEFPESSDFANYMLEYMALNTNISVAIRNYNGEGNYSVTEDNKTYRVPIRFEREKSNNNKVYISSFFGERYLTIAGVTKKNFHRGLDFAVPSGTPIVAAADGEIVRSDYSKSYGNVIEIKHNDTYSTVYAHNARLLAKVGDKVKKGDIISLSGNTGVSTGPHLHFEIKQNGNPIDPFDMLNLKVIN